MTQQKETSTTRKGVVIALLAVLLAGAGVGVGAWVFNATPEPTPIAEPTIIPTPEQVPAPAPESIFVRSDFCDQNGVPNDAGLGDFATLYDFTNPVPVEAPLDFGINRGQRLLLIDGCDPLTSKPEVVFTPIDVAGDHCQLTHPNAVPICRDVHTPYNPPYAIELPAEFVFNEKNGNELPEWLAGKQMWHIGTSTGIDPSDGYSYTVPASSGTWEMTVTYNGQTYTTTVTVARDDASDIAWDKDSERYN